ncbi:MAG: hypothetical protein WCE38_06250 [Burkholderiales bacterium]
MHDGDVFQYILEGEWRIGTSTKRFGPGFMQYEQKALFYGPLISGAQGPLFLVICDNAPSFIEPPDAQRSIAPEADYESWERLVTPVRARRLADTRTEVAQGSRRAETGCPVAAG